jgi:acetamidase/formamidase
MGFDEDLNKALEMAKAESAKLLVELHGVPREQALKMVPQVADCRVTQVVDIKKGVHCMVPKDPAKRLSEPRPTAETPQHLVSYKHDTDINKAMDAASWGMLEQLQKEKGLSRLDAYGLASITMDCRVGEMMAADKGVHCLLSKGLWVKR